MWDEIQYIKRKEKFQKISYIYITNWTFDMDTQLRQHPFRVTDPIQPKQEIIKRTAPTPMNKYINLQK